MRNRFRSAKYDTQDCYNNEKEARIADGTWYLGVDPETYFIIGLVSSIRNITMRNAAMVVFLESFEDIFA